VEGLLAACREVADGKLAGEFPIDVFQTGFGNLEQHERQRGDCQSGDRDPGGDRFALEKPIHPNDHVNMGQSTNDTFPTAIHVAVACDIQRDLIPALQHLQEVLADKARQWDKIIKIGRTHLMDATPLRLGQEFNAFARQIELSVERARQAMTSVHELPVGGTAVGSGINTHPEFGARVSRVLAEETASPLWKRSITSRRMPSEMAWSTAMGNCEPLP
jgi:fumarate hydratase, class II